MTLTSPRHTLLAKNMRPMTALRAKEDGHILHHAQDRHRHLPEHGDAFHRILESDILRRGHNDRPIQLDLLRDRQLRIARPRREVQDQDVQTAPLDLVQELLQRLHDHETAPHDRCFFVDEIAHRHGFDAIVRQRDQLILCNT